MRLRPQPLISRNSALGSTTSSLAPAAVSSSSSACWRLRTDCRTGSLRPSGRDSGTQDRARTTSWPDATTALRPVRIPPSMYRRPSMVTGGNTPGTAQLDATARWRGTPASASQTRNSPVSASTAVQRYRSGQAMPSTEENSSTYRSSSTVGASRATRPTARRVSSKPAPASVMLCKVSTRPARLIMTCWSEIPGRGSAARARMSGRLSPVVSWAPTTEPAEVPTTRSTSGTAMPASTKPVTRPDSQPIPTGPPPPRMSARDMATHPTGPPAGSSRTERLLFGAEQVVDGADLDEREVAGEQGEGPVVGGRAAARAGVGGHRHVPAGVGRGQRGRQHAAVGGDPADHQIGVADDRCQPRAPLAKGGLGDHRPLGQHVEQGVERVIRGDQGPRPLLVVPAPGAGRLGRRHETGQHDPTLPRRGQAADGPEEAHRARGVPPAGRVGEHLLHVDHDQPRRRIPSNGGHGRSLAQTCRDAPCRAVTGRVGGRHDLPMREEPPTRSRVAWPTVVPLDDGIELRQWRAALVEQLSAAVEANVEHLRGWMPWIADEPVSIPDRRRLLTLWESAWEAGTDHHYGIFDGDTTVGSVGVMDRLGRGRREIGYWLDRAYTGRGIVTAAVRELTTVALS